MNDISTKLSMTDPGFSLSLSESMSVPVCSESRGCWDITQSSRQGEESIGRGQVRESDRETGDRSIFWKDPVKCTRRAFAWGIKEAME